VVIIKKLPSHFDLILLFGAQLKLFHNYILMADKLDTLLKDDNEMKLENINLAIEREQIFTRMNLLTQEKDKFKKLHTQL
jgi:hypothetical protein